MRTSIRQGFARNSTRSSRKNIKPRNRPVFRTKVMASPGELKSVTLSGTAASNCSIVTCTLLNPTAQGDEINQRIGRETRMKHINIRGFYRAVAEATGKSTLNRLLVVYDKQPNHTIMDGSMLFESLATTAVDVTKQYNLDNRRRFTVLYDRYYPLDLVEYGRGGQKVPVYIDFNLNLPVIFNATTTAVIGAIETGALYLVTMADAADAGDYESELVYTSRIRYEDK